MKLKSKKTIPFKGKVYDLTVEETHSYNIEGLGVHNSAAGCLLSWCLDITKIDPIRFDLYFERFLNPYRTGAPDIDLDVCSGTDHIVDEFLYAKYGRERVLPVCTFSTFSEKNTLKDVVRAFRGDEETGFNSEVAQVTKEMPNFDKVPYSLADWFRDWPKSPECSEIVRNFLTSPANEEILKHTLKLYGQVRGIGQHAAGIVITPGPMWEYLPPNIISKSKTIVTAYQEADKSGKDLSALGILKLDRLKLETLNSIKDAIELIKKTKSVDIQKQIDFINLEDKNLFDELKLGLNHGIFQFESSGMNSLIKGINIENFDELTAANALYRPGPMGIGAHHEYIRNKFDKTKINLVHPALESILEKTNGVLVYQEQLMFLANKIGGLTLGEGDNLRRYMDKAGSLIAKETAGTITDEEKKNKDFVAFKDIWGKFLAGAEKMGYKKEEVDVIKDWVIKYLGYSFNKCLSENHHVISRTRGKIKMLEVEIGEEILGYNPITKTDEFNKVLNIHRNGIKEVYKVFYDYGDTLGPTRESPLGLKSLECTLDHKIMTPIGMKSLLEIWDNFLKVKISNGFDYLDTPQTMRWGEVETYDLEIDSEFHNFYANGICVSNSHSCSYSYLAMQTLYLKHYYPTEFYTALLNHPKTSGGKEKEQAWIGSAISAAISKGIKICPPSRKSEWSWMMTGDQEITMGISSINGVGDIGYAELVALLKQENKKLDEISRYDFFNLPFSKFDKGTFEACVKSGMFDDWSKSREHLMYLKTVKKKKVPRNQLSMFDFSSPEFEHQSDDAKFAPTTERQKNLDFMEVCSFDLDLIRRITEIKNKLNERAALSGYVIDSINNFEEDGYYFFIVNEVQQKKTVKNQNYLYLKVGDGIQTMSIRIFEPDAKDMKDKFIKDGVYVSQFEKNKKGFLNFKRKAKLQQVDKI